MGIASESFPELLERRAPARDFAMWFKPFSEPRKLSTTDWMELVVPVACAVGDFGWMTSSERGWVKACILAFTQRAFTELWTPGELSSGSVQDALKGFISWVESLPDRLVVEYCWDLLTYDRSFTPDPIWWLKRSGRLAGAISYDHIHFAVSVADEGDAMYWWPELRWAVMHWDRDSRPYIELLSHPSYLVRAAAAKTLGHMFHGVNTKSPGGGAPQLLEMLRLIQDYETKTPGIAGPFLDGAQWSVEIEDWSSFCGGFDMKAWFMATLRQSDREYEVPHIQSLEFYAHELFSRDAGAIREFLDMGRKELAVMTATEDPAAIPELLPVLNEMASWGDPAVSAAIREYLSTGSRHAGLQHLRGRDEEIV